MEEVKPARKEEGVPENGVCSKGPRGSRPVGQHPAVALYREKSFIAKMGRTENGTLLERWRREMPKKP